jgi:predicted O-methyltransferase YrrM
MDNITLTEYIRMNNANIIEGYSQQITRQVDLLKDCSSNAKEILEIGFNAGHSAEVFLKVNSNVRVTSFDIGYGEQLDCGKNYIDIKYPDRHTLIIGDSTKTIPEYIKNNPNKKFDILFIDGGHSYEVAMADLKNCASLSHKDSIVLMDDTIYTNSLIMDWTEGPTKAWLEGLETDLIKEIGREDWLLGRGMSWGRYSHVPKLGT